MRRMSSPSLPPALPSAAEPQTSGAASAPRRALRKLWRALPRGLRAGVATQTGLMALAYLGGSGLSYFGVSNQRMTEEVRGEYLGLGVQMLLLIFATHLLVGAVQGAAMGRLLHLAGPRLEGRRPWSRALRQVLGVLLLHGLALATSMAQSPQLYVEAFHLRGGIWTGLQELICMHLPSWLWPLFLLGILLIWTGLELLHALRAAPRSASALGTLLAPLALGLWVTLGAGASTPELPPEAAPPLGASAASAHLGAADPERPNLLILATDSLRPDRLASDPRQAAVAPTLASLAREGVVFDRAYSVIPRTFPAWVSLLTGQSPAQHGVRHMFPTVADRSDLPEALPAILKRRGYSSAVISDFAGDVFSRVGLGFDAVEVPYFHFPTLVEQRALELDHHLLPYVANRLGRRVFPVIDEFAQDANPGLLTDRALDQLAALPEPWFAVVFYSTSHFPYAAPAPYYRLYCDPAYEGPFKYHKPPDLAAELAGAADVEQVRCLYDGAVRSVDDQIKRLLDRLDGRGVLRRTVVTATADHGENLYEGSLGMGHGDHLRGETSLRVPLLFWAPGRIPAGRRVAVPVASTDLAPTLLEIAGSRQLPPMQGSSLRPLWQDPAAAARWEETHPVMVETGLWFTDHGEDFYQKLRLPYPDLTVVAEVDRGANHEVVLQDRWAPRVEMAKHRALYQGDRKLIYMPTPQGVVWELYDPLRDPLNEHDLAAQEPERLAQLQGLLLERLAPGEPERVQQGYLLPKRRSPRLAPLPEPSWLARRPGRLLP